MAIDDRFEAVCPSAEWQTERIVSMTTAHFLDRLARGAPIHDRAQSFERRSRGPLLLERVRPAAVVGDFRLSLSISARLAGVPSQRHQRLLEPVRTAALARAGAAVDTLRSGGARRPRSSAPRGRWRFARHARAMEASRRARGLHGLGHDLLRHYTEGDSRSTPTRPSWCRCSSAGLASPFGPVPWSPPMALPAWWSASIAAQASIYVTLGSSGSAARLPAVSPGLARLGMPVVAATAGAPLPASMPATCPRALPAGRAWRRRAASSSATAAARPASRR